MANLNEMKISININETISCTYMLEYYSIKMDA